MSKIEFVSFLVLITTLISSCGSDDDSEQNNCSVVTDQVAQGNFRGVDFVSPGGTYIESPGSVPGYGIKIYVKDNIAADGDCVFPEFEGIQDVILFGIPSLDPQTIEFSDISGANTINFNRIEPGPTPLTTVELAECGVVEIISVDAATNELRGTIVANGQEGSVVDGNFVLDLCVF